MVTPQVAAAATSKRRPQAVTDLRALKSAWEKARQEWLATLESEFPGLTEWHWFRALEAVKGAPCRRNDDTSQDEALAASPTIKAAYDRYIEKLHAFYRARDGERGFLGGRGA